MIAGENANLSMRRTCLITFLRRIVCADAYARYWPNTNVAEMMNLEAVPQPDCPPVFISVNVKANVARLVPSMLAASVLGKGCSMVL